MPLSDVAIRAAKPATTVQKLSDGGGLQLWLMPNGASIWLAGRGPVGQRLRSPIAQPLPRFGRTRNLSATMADKLGIRVAPEQILRDLR